MQESVNNYLRELLTQNKEYVPTHDEQKKITANRSGYIFDKLMRKKFRMKVSDSTRENIAKKITNSIAASEPIHLAIPFGGYKHFWNSSHPEPDWAELFHFRWMAEYVGPILAIYEPGVLIEYVSEDLILPRMNNYPIETLDAYAKSFKELIVWYKQYLPSNLQIQFWRVSEKHDSKAIIEKVEKLLPERKKAFKKLSKEEQEKEIHRSLRSVYWKGGEDLSGLSEEAKRNRIIESRLIELAFYDTEGSDEFVGDYYWRGNNIAICFSFGLSTDNDEFGDLTIHPAPGSIVDFWIGRGVLFKAGDKFRNTIISQQQYRSLKDKLKTIEVKPELVPLKNYKSIEIIEN